MLDTTHGTPVDVHGGVTWAWPHLPSREPDGRWWVGFDCGHGGDFIPVLGAASPGKIIRDRVFVVRECRKLIDAAAMAGGYRLWLPRSVTSHRVWRDRTLCGRAVGDGSLEAPEQGAWCRTCEDSWTARRDEFRIG